MALVTQPLRDEHQELLPHLERVREAAESIGREQDPGRSIDRALEFLQGHLLPHAAAEEAVLYPQVARLMNSAQATKTMEADHAAVSRLTSELRQLRDALKAGPPSDEQAAALRRLLYGLYTLIRLHFTKEELVYLPVLDEGLSPDAAAAMFAGMERAAAHAREAG
jgi:iron-sulfur cluster repair protein YtfE (RIC family)